MENSVLSLQQPLLISVLDIPAIEGKHVHCTVSFKDTFEVLHARLACGFTLQHHPQWLIEQIKESTRLFNDHIQWFSASTMEVNVVKPRRQSKADRVRPIELCREGEQTRRQRQMQR